MILKALRKVALNNLVVYVEDHLLHTVYAKKKNIYSLRLHYHMQVKTVLQSLSSILFISYNDGILLTSQLDVERVTYYD